MALILANIQRLMLVSGVLTLTMGYAAIAPEAALQPMFGESLDGDVADLVVRNWAVLIALMGVLLIWGARNPAVRTAALAVAGTSKAVFVGLVLSHGGRFLVHQAGFAVAVDAMWVAVFAAYLVGARRASVARQPVGVA